MLNHLASLAMSISVLEALPGKLDIKRNSPSILYTVKPVLSGHSKIYKTMVLKTNGSLMKVESIAECSKRAFCNTFDLH